MLHELNAEFEAEKVFILATEIKQVVSHNLTTIGLSKGRLWLF